MHVNIKPTYTHLARETSVAAGKMYLKKLFESTSYT